MSKIKNQPINPTIDSRNYIFNGGIANDYGANIAVFLANMAFWTETNLANNKNIHDGLCWTYNTLEALQDQFFYLTKSQLETIIKNCIDNKLIVKGNYNHTTYDRTCWYALTPKTYVYFDHLLNEKYLKRLWLSISEKSEMDFAKFRNGFPENRKTIPNNKTDNKTDVCCDKKSPGKHGSDPTITPPSDPTITLYDSKISNSNCDVLKENEKPNSSTHIKELTSNPTTQQLFNAKFQDRKVTIEELAQGCLAYYKPNIVSQGLFNRWIMKEHVDNYPKKNSSVVNMPMGDGLTVEERMERSKQRRIQELADYEQRKNNCKEAIL